MKNYKILAHVRRTNQRANDNRNCTEPMYRFHQTDRQFLINNYRNRLRLVEKPKTGTVEQPVVAPVTSIWCYCS